MIQQLNAGGCREELLTLVMYHQCKGGWMGLESFNDFYLKNSRGLSQLVECSTNDIICL